MFLVGCSTETDEPIGLEGAEQELIVGVVQDFLQALEAGERVRLERALHEDATLTRIDTRGESVVVSTTECADWISMVSEPGPPLIERMEDVEVRLTERLAHVWAFYTFHIGDDLSHCGFDSFQLIKNELNGWRIFGVTYTIETCL